MNKLIRYDEFLLESEFNKIIEDIYFVVESKGKWVDDRTYEWDFKEDDKTEQPDWIDKTIDKVEEFISKIPKDKVKSYFVKLMNSLKSVPDFFRKKLIRGYLTVFLVIASLGYLTSESPDYQNLDPEIKKEIVEVSKVESVKANKSNFNVAQKLVKTAEAGYSDDRSDSGNWIEIPGYGQRFVGTNHGISAQTLKEYLGRNPKKEDMMNLKYSDALKIYKKNYWDKQNLSEFKNQSVSNLVYDGCVNQGVPGTREILRQAYRDNGLDVENPFSKESIRLANRLDQKDLFNSIKKFRMIRYRNSRTWSVHGEGWTNRLSEINFSENNLKFV